jgi:hypothetical protein
MCFSRFVFDLVPGDRQIAGKVSPIDLPENVERMELSSTGNALFFIRMDNFLKMLRRVAISAGCFGLE